MATNHFGHFLLTLLLFPELEKAEDGRIVSVSSSLHKIPRAFNFEDLEYKKGGYTLFGAYAQVMNAGRRGRGAVPSWSLSLARHLWRKRSHSPLTYRASLPMCSSPWSCSGAWRGCSRNESVSTAAAPRDGCWRQMLCTRGMCRRRYVCPWMYL